MHIASALFILIGLSWHMNHTGQKTGKIRYLLCDYRKSNRTGYRNRSILFTVSPEKQIPPCLDHGYFKFNGKADTAELCTDQPE